MKGRGSRDATVGAPAPAAGMRIGYMRVSRAGTQDLALQEAALRKDGCERIFSDASSGSRWERPGMAEMLAQLRRNDEVVVWKLDRVTRSLRDLVLFIDLLRERKAGLRSLTEPFDTTGSMGRMVAQMLGVIAEFERQIIIERTRAGLEIARADGRVGGRPRALRDDQARKIVEDVTAGRLTRRSAASLFGVSIATVRRLVIAEEEQRAAAAAQRHTGRKPQRKRRAA